MLTEVDIERIMASQRQLTESLSEPLFYKEDQDLENDDELFQMLNGMDVPVSETNGLM